MTDTSPEHSAPDRPSVRNQKACDTCRSRKVKCRFTDDSRTCEGCKFLGTSCTQDVPRRRRGRVNRHALDHQRSSPSWSPVGEAQTESNTRLTPQLRTECLVAPKPMLTSPSGTIGSADSLVVALGPDNVIEQVLDDWFKYVHPLCPLMHRRHFLHRLRRGDTKTSKTFLGLVIAQCGVTAATIRRKVSQDYSAVTVEGCVELIERNDLLKTDSYSVDWCVAQYHFGSALAASAGLADRRVFRAIKDAMAGVQWLLFLDPREKSLPDQEILKRLFWLLAFWDFDMDMNGNPVFTILPYNESFANLRPRCLSDKELDPYLILDPESAPWPDENAEYIHGLNAAADIFMTWRQAKMDRAYVSPEEALDRGLRRIQEILDNLPPELRWRGGLSRVPRPLWGHNVQMLNISISSLYLKSNLLQQFGSSSAELSHQQIICDVLQVLNHLPRAMFEANGISMVGKLRDIGAAYLDELKVGSSGVVVDESAKEKVERLLKQLEVLDFRPGLEFSPDTDEDSFWEYRY